MGPSNKLENSFHFATNKFKKISHFNRFKRLIFFYLSLFKEKKILYYKTIEGKWKI